MRKQRLKCHLISSHFPILNSCDSLVEVGSDLRLIVEVDEERRKRLWGYGEQINMKEGAEIETLDLSLIRLDD